jgi:hypothetical protein
MIPVLDEKGILRDEKSKSLIINNDIALIEYEQRKKAKLAEKQRLSNLEAKVQNIESMLAKILEKVSQ